MFLVESERTEEARSALVEATSILRAAGAPDPAELGRAETNLAHVLGVLGRHGEGLEHAREGLRLLESAPEARPQDLARARAVQDGLETAATRKE